MIQCLRLLTLLCLHPAADHLSFAASWVPRFWSSNSRKSQTLPKPTYPQDGEVGSGIKRCWCWYRIRFSLHCDYRKQDLSSDPAATPGAVSRAQVFYAGHKAGWGAMVRPHPARGWPLVGRRRICGGRRRGGAVAPVQLRPLCLPCALPLRPLPVRRLRAPRARRQPVCPGRRVAAAAAPQPAKVRPPAFARSPWEDTPVPLLTYLAVAPAHLLNDCLPSLC